LPLTFWTLSILGLLAGLKTKRPFLGLIVGLTLAFIIEVNLCPKH
jgi:hypothetical protein